MHAVFAKVRGICAKYLKWRSVKILEKLIKAKKITKTGARKQGSESEVSPRFIWPRQADAAALVRDVVAVP